jgi:hypothetical protein
VTIVDAETGQVIPQTGQSLQRFTQAERMLAEVASVQEAVTVTKFAEAARVYAKEVGLGTSSINYATAIKARALCRLADMVDAGQAAGEIAKKTDGRPKKSKESLDISAPALIKDLGTTSQQIKEARKLRDFYGEEGITREERAATESDEPLTLSGLVAKAEVERDKGKEIRTSTLIKEAAAAETKRRRQASRNAKPLPDGADLRIGDAREVLEDVADDSVALVLTDPPYGDEAEPLYDWLAKWATRVLIPGGSLICYTGQSRLDRDMRILGEHLRYWWLLAMMHHQSQRLPGKFVVAEFKPVLWFVKDNRRGRTLVNDVLRPPKREKDDHDWSQGEGGVPLLVEQLTAPGELIADPFAGTARWGAIAAGMGRYWVGAEAIEDPAERGEGVVRT